VSIHTLVVDDEWAVRALLRDVLEDGGHRVTEAENGVEAERALESESFDLVVTDLVMPERDGLETLRYVKGRFPELPVVVAGTAANDILLRCAHMMGAAAVLVKPFRRSDIEGMLARVRAMPDSRLHRGERVA
jgi:CheY-like chemotaxis protein